MSKTKMRIYNLDQFIRIIYSKIDTAFRNSKSEHEARSLQSIRDMVQQYIKDNIKPYAAGYISNNKEVRLAKQVKRSTAMKNGPTPPAPVDLLVGQELLPCPFCGGAAVYKYVPDVLQCGFHNITCPECVYTYGAYSHRSNAAGVIAKWNTRAEINPPNLDDHRPREARSGA